MSVFIEVWHRVFPLTAEAYDRFAAYYGEWVVNANLDSLDVVGGWRYALGDSNTDMALYRYPSMSAIEEAMAAFGGDDSYVQATEALFSDIEIEEVRSISAALPFSGDDRIEQALRGKPRTQRRYVRLARSLPSVGRPSAYDALDRLVEAREKAGLERLVVATENVIGNVMQGTEIWVLPEGVDELERTPPHVDPELLREVEARAPEVSRDRLEPLPYSRLR
jgi:hypothetical protein